MFQSNTIKSLFTVSNLKETFLIVSLLLNLFTNTISSFKGVHYPFKFLGLAAAFISFYLYINEIELKEIFRKFKVTFLIFSIMIFLPAFTLFYSKNSYFGIEKLFNLAFFIFPAIFLFILFLEKINDALINKTLFITFTFTISASLIIVLTNPFSFESSYTFSINRWSHVLIGRYFTPIILLFIYFLLISKSIKINIYSIISLGIMISALLISSNRTAVFAFITGIFLLLSFYKIKLSGLIKINHIIFIVIIIISAIILFDNQIIERLLLIFSTGKNLDGSWTSRLNGLNITLELIKENWLFGVGFGGFKYIYESNLTYILKYPHNFILEWFVEVGIIGLIFSIWFIYYLIKTSLKIEKIIFLLLVTSIIFSFTSKDISSQIQIYLFIPMLRGQKTDIRGQRISPQSGIHA